MPPPCLLLLPLAAVLLLVVPFSTAYTCSLEEQQTVYGLIKSAAALAGCAPYAEYSASGSVSIKYTCTATTCIPIIQQLASQLPNCDYPSDGINRRTAFEDGLYRQCQVCTFDQLDQIDALWKSAAQTSACAPYSSSIGLYTSFSWPCSATGCTAVLTELSSKVPSCYSGGENERTRIINGISACTGTTVSTRSPSPVSPSTDTSTSSPSPTAGGSATAAPTTAATTSAPTTAVTSTTTDPPEATSPSPTYSATACSASSVTEITDLYVAAGTSANCKANATVASFAVSISAKCSSLCVLVDLTEMAAVLPDCFYDYDSTNKKRQATEALARCSLAPDQYATLKLNVATAISSPSSQTGTRTTAPAVSAGERTRRCSAVFAGVAITAAFAL